MVARLPNVEDIFSDVIWVCQIDDWVRPADWHEGSTPLVESDLRVLRFLVPALLLGFVRQMAGEEADDRNSEEAKDQSHQKSSSYSADRQPIWKYTRHDAHNHCRGQQKPHDGTHAA